MSVWFITGASPGFGLEIVREALDRGDSVVAPARTPEAAGWRSTMGRMSASELT